MTLLVLDGDLLEDALRDAGEEELVIAVDASAGRLEEFEAEVRDPRVLYLIGDAHVLPLPDAFVDSVVGSADEAELARVLRT